MLIDKKGKINASHIRKLFDGKEDDHEISFFDSTEEWIVSTTVKDAIVDIFKQNVKDDVNLELYLVCDEEGLVFTGKDFNWFLKKDRLQQLIDDVYGNRKQTVASTKSTDIPTAVPVALTPTKEFEHVAVVSIENPDKIEEFKGTKQDCVKWLNQAIVRHATLENDVMLLICLDYDSENPDWKTLKELFEEGKIEI